MEKVPPRLLSYHYVPAGFEIVINDMSMHTDRGGGIWNLWWNVQVSDDPGTWDNEIRALNTMQKESGHLTKNHRYVRIHIAEWCRNDDTFPTSLDILCAEIGNEKITTPWTLGCEGRGLRDSLGIHASPDDRLEQRVFLFNSYQIAFKAWINQREPETLLEAKVRRYLGEVTREKIALVDLLRRQLIPTVSSTASLKEIYKEKTQGISAESLSQCLDCGNCTDIESERIYPECSCCERFYIDSLLLFQRFIEPNEIYREMFRFHQECLLGYMYAVNAWLIDEEPTLLTDVVTPVFLNQQLAEQIPKQVKRLLGIRTPVKEWLAGCLLKTLRGNRSWKTNHQMIDNYPEASSWLSFIRV
ncbi:MAG: hypothetical protein ACFFE2_03625 [Candidatus Thorarchaeota archaeon]